jgi:hypothetical protein
MTFDISSEHNILYHFLPHTNLTLFVESACIYAIVFSIYFMMLIKAPFSVVNHHIVDFSVQLRVSDIVSQNRKLFVLLSGNYLS